MMGDCSKLRMRRNFPSLPNILVVIALEFGDWGYILSLKRSEATSSTSHKSTISTKLWAMQG